jgi:hypothetical protein
MFTTHRTITATIALASLLVLSAGSLPATARQAPGPTVVQTIPDESHCTLARVGTQYVKCDDLTGNGVAAPSWIPLA